MFRPSGLINSEKRSATIQRHLDRNVDLEAELAYAYEDEDAAKIKRLESEIDALSLKLHKLHARGIA